MISMITSRAFHQPDYYKSLETVAALFGATVATLLVLFFWLK
jgi:hypothetical protein